MRGLSPDDPLAILPGMLLSAVLLLAAAGLFPSAPTLTTFHTRDFGGRSYDDVLVRSSGGRLRVDAFGKVFVFDGAAWFSERPVAEEDSGAVAFLAPFAGEGVVERADAAGRPAVLVDVPAGRMKARIEYRWDEAGLAAANLVFTDGSGYQFRRESSRPGDFPPTEFDPPRVVAPPAGGVAPGGNGAPDRAAVERLFALSIGDAEQLAFEKEGGIGRFRPRTPR